MGKPVSINLTVSAYDLFNANPQPTTQDQLNSYCSLSDDNNGSTPDGKNADFVSNVYSGQQVTWTGSNSTNPNDNGYRILITEINNNSSFFPTNPLNGQSGRVNATCDSNIGSLNDTYSIYFEINPPGNGTPKSYRIDPKLQGNN